MRHYFPISKTSFGSSIPEMQYANDTTKGYRYGFNGEELESDIAGDGMSYDLGARFYDGRLGRMFSIDPLESSYPWQSPYAYCYNNPVSAIDIDGMGGDPQNTFVIDNKNGKKGVYGIAREVLGNNASESDVAYLAKSIIKSNNLVRQANGNIKISVGQTLFIPGFSKFEGAGWVQNGTFAFDHEKKMAELGKKKEVLTKQYWECVSNGKVTSQCSTVCDNLSAVNREINNEDKRYNWACQPLPDPALAPCYIDFDILTFGRGSMLFSNAVRRKVITESTELAASKGAFTLTKHGELTNGVYTVSKEAMKKHVYDLGQGKSIFYNTINAEEAVLKAAQYADEAGLWIGNKAKVPVLNTNIGRLGNGTSTNFINVYRNSKGAIHGSPGTIK